MRKNTDPLLVKTNTFLLLSFLLSGLFLITGCAEEERYNGMGEMRLNLATDNKLTVFTKSGDTEADIPSVNDFTVHLEHKEGSYSKTFVRYSEMDENLTLPIGEYTITAYHGEESEEGFNTPYFSGSSNFVIGEGKTTTVDLTCTLGNVKVFVNLSDGFVNYFKSYYVSVVSGSAKNYYFDEDTDESLYIQPGSLALEITVTKQNGNTATYEPISITNTEAAEYYIFNVDVNGGEVGGESISITFNDETEETPIYIDLSDEAMNVKEPFFTLTGFENGQVFTITEGTSLDELSVLITARGKFKSVLLTVESPSLNLDPIDLVGILAYQNNQLKNAGFEWTEITEANNENSNQSKLQMAIVNFSDVISTLRSVGEDNEHTFVLTVTDQNGKKSSDLSFSVLTQNITFDLKTPEPVYIGSTSAIFEIETDGDPNQVRIFYNEGFGAWKEGSAHKVIKSENNIHIIQANLPVTNKPLQVKAIYNTIDSNSEYLSVAVPDYTLTINDEADIWANKAVVSIQAANQEQINGILKYITLYKKSGDSTSPLTSELIDNKIVVYGLSPDTEVSIVGKCLDEDYSEELVFTTEYPLPLPNGNFDDGWDEFYNNSLQQGGRYRTTVFGSGTYNTKTKNLITNTPSGWSTVNQKTMPLSASNQNTWYIVPSTEQTNDAYMDDYAVKISNVAWDDNGVAIADFSKALSSGGASYCENVPSKISYRSAGKLFLGDYYYNHDTGLETYEEGIEFHSRPKSISGYYKYNAVGNDIGGTVSITLENRDGGSIVTLGYGSDTLTPENGYTFFNIPINYLVLNKKATHIKVMFTSSTYSSYIQEEESTKIETRNRNSTTEAVSTGSELYLDNIQLNYE